MIQKEWFKLSIVGMVLIVFGTSLWWFGIRPASIKSKCAIVQHYRGEVQEAQPASPDWPECLKQTPSDLEGSLEKE